MPSIYLIRHAPVAADLTIPADRWTLNDEGRTLADDLATLPVLTNLRAVYTSPEPKARATAEPLAQRCTIPLIEQPDLAELRRGPTNIAGRAAYEAAVRAAFADPARSIGGWEPAAAAQARIVACVRRLAQAHDEPIAIVSHGLALSLLLAHVQGQAQVSFEVWRAIPMPALAIIDAHAWRVVAPFQSLAAWQATARTT